MISPIEALYIHVPFCVRRCSYCDFASSTYQSDRAEAYLEALAVEFDRRATELEPTTIYIGGGTPTALSVSQLELLFDLVGNLELAELHELTVEANPGTLTQEKLALLKDVGVTRVSLGVQSFQPEGLEVLGRIHTAKQARGAISYLREMGFDEISIDLMYAWPGQDERLWAADLATVGRLGLSHVSAYCLSYESNTPLRELERQGAVRRQDESQELRLMSMAEDVLGGLGLNRYEISNHARPGAECRHNIHYWQGGQYVGLGAGAYSFRNGDRTGNERDVRSYIRRMSEAGCAEVERDQLSARARARECAVMWLRLLDGIDPTAFQARTGFDLEELLGGDLPHLLQGGWLEWTPNQTRLRLTSRALPVADSVLSELVL